MTKLAPTQVRLCFLHDYPSLQEGIFSLCAITKSGLKKLKLNKKFLDKKIRIKDEVLLPINIVNFGKINPTYVGASPEVLYEDDKFLVLSKPHKIHTHPLSYDEQDNLLSFLESKYLEVNNKKYDRGLVYRLDYETSGIIYYAKVDQVYQSIRERFNTLVKQKFYLAHVTGDIQDQSIEHFLVKGESRGSVTKEDASGKKCNIEIKKLSYNEKSNQALIMVKLYQGFKHQIRAQLSFIGYPIVGDDLYGGISSNRLWLHCYQYCFYFDGKEYNKKDNSTELESFFRNFDCEL